MNKFFYTFDKNKISKIKKKLLDFPHGNHTVLDKDCIFLSNLILYFKPKNILEIGTWIGKSTYSMCIASSENHKNFFIDSIDVHRKIYRSKFVNFSRNIKFHNGHSSRILPKLNKKYDFIFVDANLDLLSAKCLTKLIHKNTIIVFHDYYPLGDKGLQNLINLSKFLKYNYIVDETRMFPKIKDYVNLYNGSYSKYFNFNDSKFNGTCCVIFPGKLHKKYSSLKSENLINKNFLFVNFFYLISFVIIMIYFLKKIIRIKTKVIYPFRIFNFILYFDLSSNNLYISKIKSKYVKFLYYLPLQSVRNSIIFRKLKVLVS